LKEERTAITVVIKIIKILTEERDVLTITINILNQEIGKLKKIIIRFINPPPSFYFSVIKNNLNALTAFFQSYLIISLITIFSVSSPDKIF
jgi:hypothetical protein